MTYQERLLKVIPAGAHIYSRGFDYFPENGKNLIENHLLL